jgi:alkanesulfonate monooxygenase SsuD/methylene tetrahydromethanopterin reductase-like flavin-dependent oxidoreductase (luciferase family)
MFVMPVHDPQKPPAQCFDEDLELAIRCEELGFTDFWVGEHHSSSYENIVMPELFIAKAFGLTKTLRMGPAPLCLQYHHPVHAAGRLAFLDHLSHGRLNVCFGPGSIPTDIEVFGLEAAECGARVVESIDMILKIWTSDPPYDIPGKFWNVRLREKIDAEMGLGELHKPLQKPHPPVHVPSIARNSVGLAKAAARGFLPISHHMVSEETLQDHWRMYRDGAESAGRVADSSGWSVSRNIFVAETTAEARRVARSNSLGKCIEYILELCRRGPGLGAWKRNPQMADSDCNLDYFMDEVVIAGDPPTVAAKILQLQEKIGRFGTLVHVAHDWDDRARWLRSLDLFANEVMPILNRELAPVV